jgi:hypothetical protein
MTTETTETRRTAAESYVGSDDGWGYTHVLSETVWTLSDFLQELAGEIEPHGFDPDDRGPSAVAGFHRQETLLAYAAELKAAAAAALDTADGGQCRARLAAIAERNASQQERKVAAEQAGQNPPPMHA